MKAQSEVSGEKLRGGFYTPEPLAIRCLDRLRELLPGDDELALLEPSIGDGAFVRALSRHPVQTRVRHLLGIEIARSEAEKARSSSATLQQTRVDVLVGSAIRWAAATDDMFDAVVGNPPFVRYQFIPRSEIDAVDRLSSRLGVSFKGVSNLWLPVLIGAISRLRIGGAAAFVVPAELFTGVSAGIAREFLLRNLADIQVDLFEPGSFPKVLQEVVVVSGRRISLVSQAPSAVLTFVEHRGGQARRWSFDVAPSQRSWTRYLITPEQQASLEAVLERPPIKRLGALASVTVSTVTGANDFFSVDRKTTEDYGLAPWVRPLLPRIRHASGLVYDASDHETTAASARAWLFSFEKGDPDPRADALAARYITLGEERQLHRRYKTRIREPWYRVPLVHPGTFMMSKRSHWFPKLVTNPARVYTTDTIYRGVMRPEFEYAHSALVAGFHNSMTLLNAELEGRSFGGGVLELVPSEIARLAVPFEHRLGGELEHLDRLARETSARPGDESLIEATNEAVARLGLISLAEFAVLETARRDLQGRRLSRNALSGR